MRMLQNIIVAAAAVSCAPMAYAQVPNQLLFYSKRNCKGNMIGNLNTYKAGHYDCTARHRECENDEASSVFVQSQVTLPLTIVVFDYHLGFGGKKTDDYSSIHIWARSQSMRTGSGVCIPSFEANYGKSWMNIDWNHGDNLDGKVSRIEISR